MISQKIIGRLSLYRRLLVQLRTEGVKNIYSHQLASSVGGTAAQVRRDMMTVGASGSPTKGYDVAELIDSIGKVLDAPEGQSAALVGVGNLGRAILHYFNGRRPNLKIVAAFDSDPEKNGRVIHGCRCFSVEELTEQIKENNITVAVIAVPAITAQEVCDSLVSAGVKGMLNFAPVPLRVPKGVYIEDIDMTMSLEKVAYFAR